MKKIAILLSLAITILTADDTYVLSSYRDPLFQRHRLQGTWNQAQVSKILGSCEPCLFMIQIYSEQVFFRIANPSFSPPKIFSYEATSQQFDKLILFTRDYSFEGKSINGAEQGTFTMKLTIQPQDGIKYSYEIQLPQLSIDIIHSQNYYTYLLPAISIGFIIIFLALFPLSKEKITLNIQKILNRINIGSLFLYMLTVSNILAYHFCMVVFYLLHYDNYIGKIAFYGIFGCSFFASIIQFGYGFAIIQMKVNERISQNTPCKLLILMGAAIYLLANPLISAFFSKYIWFHFLGSISIILQFYYSYKQQKYPCWTFLILNAFSIFYLALLSNFYPILNFHELSKLNLFILQVELIILIGAGYIILQKRIGIEGITQLTQRQKPISHPSQMQMSGGKKYSIMTEQEIKSDIQLSNQQGI